MIFQPPSYKKKKKKGVACCSQLLKFYSILIMGGQFRYLLHLVTRQLKQSKPIGRARKMEDKNGVNSLVSSPSPPGNVPLQGIIF